MRSMRLFDKWDIEEDAIVLFVQTRKRFKFITKGQFPPCKLCEYYPNDETILLHNTERSS